jgi:hypothetical protein
LEYDVIGDLFGSLLLCDECKHGVGLHDARCLAHDCSCMRNKEHVIAINVTMSIQEHAMEWRNSTTG